MKKVTFLCVVLAMVAMVPSTSALCSDKVKEAGKAAGVGVGAGAVTAAAGPTALGWLGFGSAGVIKGSIAAAVQSSVYGGSVAAGSSFASLTSLGMTAAFGPVAIGVGVVGGVGYLAYNALADEC